MSRPSRLAFAARWLYGFRDALSGLKRHVILAAAVVATVAVSLLLLGSSLLVREQVELAVGSWQERIELHVFLCAGDRCAAPEDHQVEALADDLADDGRLTSVAFESSSEAYDRFTSQFADDPELVDLVDPEAMPASFRVTLVDPEEATAIAEDYEDYAGVEEVVDQAEILEPFLSVSRAVQAITFAVAGVLLAASAVLIGNTLRMAAYARRDHSAILKLVGASNAYVRGPFVLEGLVAALIGAGVAWGTLRAAVPLLVGQARDHVQFMPFIGVSDVNAVGPVLVVVAAAVAVLSAAVVLRRHLTI